ncbi:MAG: hypothetical protein GXO64_02325 [Candidatus Micrarchaeota archaeon]|nr:hypothetical protein [Candidatus Micrarchaeota archaeon]
MERRQKTVIAISIVVLFSLLVLSLSFYYLYQRSVRQSARLTYTELENMTADELRTHIAERWDSDHSPFYNFYLIPFSAFIGLLIGTIIYYLMSDEVEQKKETAKKNTRIILRFLTPEDRKVIDILLENGGSVPQYELSRLPGLNKVKTHRILAKLEQKGIISKEQYGKINKIILNKEIYDVLK